MNYNITTLLFDWDISKAAANLKKHDTSFELAKTVFDDPLQISVADQITSTEERWATLGMAADGKILVVIHTYASQETTDFIRIISARRATLKERRQYEEGV